LTNSPAIDAGDPAGCIDQDGDPLTTDQRGAPRPFGDRCDIGAFEFGSLPPDTSDLAITKTVADDEIELGDQVNFTLTVSNTGVTNTQVVAIDDLPLGLSLVSATGSGADCTTSGNSLSCVAATLDGGASFSVTVIATAETVGTWENTATVSGEAQELDPANNSDSVTVEVVEDDNGGGGCMLGSGSAPSSMLSLTWLAALGGAFLLRRRG
ncbi:MAG TPA: DUF11 domain-containing protein, partial [bacterium]|nr:DUF11 domain-containing protein [bacterium]